MPRRLCAVRSRTPVASDDTRIQPGRLSVQRSVTRHPSVASAKVYSQVLIGTPNTWTSNAKRLPTSAAVIVTDVIQTARPCRLVPRNFAPTAGPAAPPTHLPPVFSGLHSPIRGRSLTSSYSRNEEALTVS